MPLITSEIITALAKEDDFGFELRVGRVLRAFANERVHHAETYTDPRTDKEREFDYQCVIVRESCRLQLAVECKNLFLDSPAVVCGQRRVASESFHDIVFAGQGYLAGEGQRPKHQEGIVSEVIQIRSQSALYPIDDTANCFVGKSVFRPKPDKNRTPEAAAKLPLNGFTNPKDDKDSYDRWNQAIGSAASMALSALQYDVRNNQSGFNYSVTLPLVVVPNESLWQLEFNDNGEIEKPAIQTRHVAVFRDQSARRSKDYGTAFYREVKLPYVHFMTEGGLVEWLGEVTHADATFWKSVFPETFLRNLALRFRR